MQQNQGTKIGLRQHQQTQNTNIGQIKMPKNET